MILAWIYIDNPNLGLSTYFAGWKSDFNNVVISHVIEEPAEMCYDFFTIWKPVTHGYEFPLDSYDNGHDKGRE